MPRRLRTEFEGAISHAMGRGVAPRIVSAYCAIVRSLENFPDWVTLRMALRPQQPTR